MFKVVLVDTRSSGKRLIACKKPANVISMAAACHITPSKIQKTREDLETLR